MLNQNICFVDFSEQTYQINSLYTQALPKSQLNLLYLATALMVRPNQITVLGAQSKPLREGSIDFLPFPEDPASFWTEKKFDIVICLDSLQGLQEIKPFLPADTPLVLWSHLPPGHVAMLPLQHQEVRDAWDAFILENHYQAQIYGDTYGMPVGKLHYRWPCMVRSLRKRIQSDQDLRQVRSPQLTLAFCDDPYASLGQTLEIFKTLKADFPELRLKVFLKPGFEPELAHSGVQAQLQQARALSEVEVFDPMPWPSLVEQLLTCHVLCSPLAFQDLSGAEVINPLAAGCVSVLSQHQALLDMYRPLAKWVVPEPAESYFERYTQAIREVLEQFQNEAENMLELGLTQISAVNTLYTWDLRVWEWESLLYQLKQPNPQQMLKPVP